MDPNNERWTAVEEGAELVREGQTTAAIAELERVLCADPRNEYACFFLGAAHYEEGSHAKALKAYLSALEIAPEYRGALVGAGHCLRMMGQLDEALRVARQLLHRVPDDPDGLHLAGVACFQRGDSAAARGYLERFLATRPEIEVALEVESMLEVVRGAVVGSEQDAEQDE